MKRLLVILTASILALSVLVGCEESKKTKTTNKTEEMEVTEKPEKTKDVEETEATDEKKDINDFVTIQEALNKEDVSPNGEKVKYIYEVPIINIDKPGAQKINDTFLNLEKDLEGRIGDGQSLTLSIKSKAFLNDEIISVVMEIEKPGPGGIYIANYDIENDKEISTNELIEKYNFNPQRLIAEINQQDPLVLDYFVDTVITNIDDDPSNDPLEDGEGIQNQTKEEKERYVLDNIAKIEAYINNDGKFVFTHRAELEDEELVVE